MLGAIEPNLNQIFMRRISGLFLENAGKMRFAHTDSLCDVCDTDAVPIIAADKLNRRGDNGVCDATHFFYRRRTASALRDTAQ